MIYINTGIKIMKIVNYFKDCGDDFDGCEIKLTNEEFAVFHKIFSNMSRDKLKALGLSEEELEIALKFFSLY